MKIIIIGCPGSGKSTLSRKMLALLDYPVLHLDKIYHIDNNNHITRDELKHQIEIFAKEYKNWIIDGNYISSVEHRINLADTIVLLDIETNICINNAIKRSKKERQDDMAQGFDNTKLNDDFLEFIKSFKTNSLPIIEEILNKYPNKKIYRITNYNQLENFLKEFNLFKKD